MSDKNRDGQGALPRAVHVGPAEKKFNWLPWLLLALGVLAALFALSRCGRDERVATPAPVERPVETVTTTTTTTASAGVSGFGAYLAGQEALPRTFAFERLNFDTASSEIRPADRDEVTAIATALKQAPGARVRVVGYADARGSSEANAALGKARADSVKSALVASGIPAVRVETVSGGEADPTDTNATASGQAENRRTELVLLQR